MMCLLLLLLVMVAKIQTSLSAARRSKWLFSPLSSLIVFSAKIAAEVLADCAPSLGSIVAAILQPIVKRKRARQWDSENRMETEANGGSSAAADGVTLIDGVDSVLIDACKMLPEGRNLTFKLETTGSLFPRPKEKMVFPPCHRTTG